MHLQEISERLSNIEKMLTRLQPQQKELEADFIGVKEVAELLRISEPSVYRLTMLKKIPFRKVHNRLFFLKSEILAFINSRAFTV